MSLVQVFYISRCGQALTSTDVHRIVGTSQLRNRRRDITGLLTYTGRHFAQVVEGSAAAIDPLLATIAADPRHEEMKVLQRVDVSSRQYGVWSMHLLDSVDRADDIERLFGPAGASADEVNGLLQAIRADARWRSGDDMAPGLSPA